MIRKNLYTVLVCSLISLNMHGQSLTPGVIAATGSTGTANGFQLDWTAGEFSTTSLLNSEGNTILTQGSRQPELQVWTGNVSTNLCPGTAVLVPVTASGIISNTNIFTAQLSDGNGSFANPVAIGTLNTNLNGNIAAVIPANTPAGNQYRIRVTSSLPAFTGAQNGSPIKINAVTLNIPDAFAYKNGVAPNTVYNGWAPAGSIKLSATASGGSGQYTFEWKDKGGKTVGSSEALTVTSPDMLTADHMYSVKATDGKGCSQTAYQTVKVVAVACSPGKGAGVQVCVAGKPECVPAEQVEALLKKGGSLGSCSWAGAAKMSVAVPQVHELETASTLGALAYPNPSVSTFTLKLSGNNSEAIILRVINQLGHVVEVRNNLSAGQTIQIGGTYHSGIYFVELMQGNKTKQIKLMKTE